MKDTTITKLLEVKLKKMRTLFYKSTCGQASPYEDYIFHKTLNEFIELAETLKIEKPQHWHFNSIDEWWIKNKNKIEVITTPVRGKLFHLWNVDFNKF